MQQHKNLVLLIPALGQNNRITLSNEPLTPSLLVSSLKNKQVRSERKNCTVTPETTHCNLLIVSLSLQEDKPNTDHDVPLSCLSPWLSEIPSTTRPLWSAQLNPRTTLIGYRLLVVTWQTMTQQSRGPPTARKLPHSLVEIGANNTVMGNYTHMQSSQSLTRYSKLVA